MSDHVNEIVSDVARRIKADLPELTIELTNHFVEMIPEFRHDEAVRQLMVASTSSNLVTGIDMLEHGIPLDQISVPAAAAEYARRFAQLDLSPEALLRAYRLGENRFMRWVRRYLGQLGLSSAQALAATEQVALMVNSYLDEVIEGLIDIYELERRRWRRRSDAVRAGQLRIVLETDDLDVGSAEEILGIALRGWHLATVAWLDAAVPDAEQQLDAVVELLTTAAGREPLTMLADDHTLWAWLSFSGPPTLDLERLRTQLAEHPRLHVALGEPDTGLRGFRSSHREALRARTVAETAVGQQPPLLEFSEVAIPALLSDNLDELRVWAVRTLGELARDDKGTARLRYTLRVFLQCGGSYTDAASQLHLHKNTVHYRVRKAEEVLGRPLTERRLNLEVSLLVYDLLGRRMIADG